MRNTRVNSWNYLKQQDTGRQEKWHRIQHSKLHEPRTNYAETHNKHNLNAQTKNAGLTIGPWNVSVNTVNQSAKSSHLAEVQITLWVMT